MSPRDVTEEEAESSVSLEPLNFGFRLPGEKLHIVPEYSSRMWPRATRGAPFPLFLRVKFSRAYLSATYGPPPGHSGAGVIGKSNPRRVRSMSATDEGWGWDSGEHNSMPSMYSCHCISGSRSRAELTALTGMGDPGEGCSFLGEKLRPHCVPTPATRWRSNGSTTQAKVIQ